MLILIMYLVVLKLAVMLTALPKPTVDYLPQANELSKPAGFTPADNAAPLYEKAFALYVEPPENLRRSPLMNSPLDGRASILIGVDPNDLVMAKKWLDANQPALELARQAAEKPCCWFEKVSEDEWLLGILLPEIDWFRKLSQALVCSARCHAVEGRFEAAAADLLAAYRMGHRLNQPSLCLIVQMVGRSILASTITAAGEVIACAKPSSDELRSFQLAFQALPACASSLGFEMDQLFLYDTVQRMYLDSIRGIDRPAFRVLLKNEFGLWNSDRTRLKEAFWGPSRYSVLQKIDRLFELYEQMKDKTPWQVHQTCQPQVREIQTLTEDGFFMSWFAPNCLQLFTLFPETRSRVEALMTVTAVLRYRQDRGRLPETLEALQAAGYLESLPMDPFSDGPLIYKTEGDAFTLYSVGEDFQDNGGKPDPLDESPGEESCFAPRRVKDRRRNQDIIYWPVLVETPKPPQPMPGAPDEMFF